MEDSTTIDQAIETISRAFSHHGESTGIIKKIIKKTKNLVTGSSILDSKKYQNISINLRNINAGRLESLLNPDIEIKEANKEIAIAQLKDKNSFFHRHLFA